ncbi:MAG TPA: methyltransferase [Cellvibrionaceae bacterium]
MNDGAYAYLIQQLTCANGHTVWFAEESCTDYLPLLAAYKDRLLLVTQRVDSYQRACALKIPVVINDAIWPRDETLFTNCVIRIAKEKPWVHHLINQARLHLPPGGRLYLAGHKQEGIKTYADKAATLFNSNQKAQKIAEFYAITLTQSSENNSELLPCENYAEYRPVLTLQEKPIVSKPGIYGWNKIDQGSQLLVDTLLNEELSTVNSCLDLGCGYGFLTLASGHLPLGLRTCTDNNSTALTACERNCRAWDISAKVILADCAEGIDEDFDLVLCNPPFHQGFSVENQLTTKFLSAAARRLNPHGVAYFVVNQFIPLERKAADFFYRCEKISANGQFKVLRLSLPKH